VRVVIGEDLALLRDGLVRILTAYGMQVVEAVDSGPKLLRSLLTQAPDVAIVDVRLPPSHTDEGLRAALEGRRQHPGLPIMILSAHIEPLYARELIADGAGGTGYPLKDRVADVTRFVEAVRVVAGGGTVLDPEVIAPMLSRPAQRGPLGRLTVREREVLTLMAQGRTNVSISAQLGITEKAVSKHINSIFIKLNLLPDHDGNRRVLAVLAYLSGHPQ